MSFNILDFGSFNTRKETNKEFSNSLEWLYEFIDKNNFYIQRNNMALDIEVWNYLRNNFEITKNYNVIGIESDDKRFLVLIRKNKNSILNHIVKSEVSIRCSI
jgi:hypothetical protein